MSSGVRALLTASVVVAGPQVLRVSLEVHRDALVVQHLTGEDQMFLLGCDAPNAARVWLAPHRYKCEGLLADAQVLLVHFASSVGAHGLDPLQVIWVEEGLCRPVTATVVPDVFLPLVLVRRPRRAISDVALQERPVAIVPLGKLAGSLVFGTNLLPEQETHNQRKIREKSHSKPKPGHKCFV